jgi:hypothetical protein
MRFTYEKDLDSVVNERCSICDQEFIAGDEVKQITIGRVIRTVEGEMIIREGKVADYHVYCRKVN